VKQRQDGAACHPGNLVQVAQKLQTIRALIPRHSAAGSVPCGAETADGNERSPAFRRGFAKSVVQASALFVVLTAAGLLAGVLGLLAGLLAAALLRLARPVLAALLLVALLLAALLARIVLIVLVHHVLSCCLAPQTKTIAKQRFQSRQYQRY
jgi:ABC-type antimicrobial peptide transport system permease subunit